MISNLDPSWLNVLLILDVKTDTGLNVNLSAEGNKEGGQHISKHTSKHCLFSVVSALPTGEPWCSSNMNIHKEKDVYGIDTESRPSVNINKKLLRRDISPRQNESSTLIVASPLWLQSRGAPKQQLNQQVLQTKQPHRSYEHIFQNDP